MTDTVQTIATAPAPLAPWLLRQQKQLLEQNGHAWLLTGPSGLGHYRMALALARAWLCETRDRNSTAPACGQCASCHAIDVRTHADLCVLMPETAALELGWPLGEKAQADIDDKKRKPSREIRVDAMREAIEFSQRTSARGMGKVVLVYPAEQMNTVTANALLKTLEEPPGDVRFVLATESAHQLLPTIRSRCQTHVLEWPQAGEAEQWLAEQGMPKDEIPGMLRAAGQRPEDALDLASGGLRSSQWAAFPKAMASGDAAFAREWAPQQLLDALQKLCHDVHARCCGAAPRFFEADALRGWDRADLSAVTKWGAELRKARRTMDHPFQPGLMQEALVDQARTILHSAH